MSGEACEHGECAWQEECTLSTPRSPIFDAERCDCDGRYGPELNQHAAECSGWIDMHKPTDSHDPRCISLTDSEFNNHCDCATLRMIDAADKPTEQESK